MNIIEKKNLIKNLHIKLRQGIDNPTEFIKIGLAQTDVFLIDTIYGDFENEVNIKQNEEYRGTYCSNKNIVWFFKSLGFVVLPPNDKRNYSSVNYWIGFDIPDILEKEATKK